MRSVSTAEIRESSSGGRKASIRSTMRRRVFSRERAIPSGIRVDPRCPRRRPHLRRSPRRHPQILERMRHVPRSVHTGMPQQRPSRTLQPQPRRLRQALARPAHSLARILAAAAAEPRGRMQPWPCRYDNVRPAPSNSRPAPHRLPWARPVGFCGLESAEKIVDPGASWGHWEAWPLWRPACCALPAAGLQRTGWQQLAQALDVADAGHLSSLRPRPYTAPSWPRAGRRSAASGRTALGSHPHPRGELRSRARDPRVQAVLLHPPWRSPPAP